MKLKAFLFSFPLFFLFHNSFANNVNFQIDLLRFLHADGKPYVEVQATVDAASLKFIKTKSGRFRGTTHLTYNVYSLKAAQKLNPDSFFVQKSGMKPVYTRGIDLHTEEIADTSGSNLYFKFLYVERIDLLAGDYYLAVEANDPNRADGKNMVVTNQFIIEPPNDKVIRFSDVNFIQKIRQTETDNYLTKNGLEITPMFSNGVFMNADSLQFYLEYYNAANVGKDPLFASVYLTDANTPNVIDKYKKTFRPKICKNFEVFAAAFNIKELPSQTYYLNFELKKNNGQLAASTRQKFFVYNKNAYAVVGDMSILTEYDRLYNYPEDQLTFFLQTLHYISGQTEKSFVSSLKTYEEKKNYFYDFWRKRSQDPADPTKEWMDYFNRLKYANQNFKANKREGWTTERGRVLLTYGAPTDIQSFDSEADKQPYTIWTYNRLGTQSGVFFVFAARTIASNDYYLLHSTKIGETQNGNWRNNLLNNRERTYNLENSDYTTPEFKDNLPSTTGNSR